MSEGSSPRFFLHVTNVFATIVGSERVGESPRSFAMGEPGSAATSQ